MHKIRENFYPPEHQGCQQETTDNKTVFDVSKTHLVQLTDDLVMSDADHMIRIIDKEGVLLDAAHKNLMSREEILKCYYYMVLSRTQDTYMTQLQRQGRMLGFAGNFGEEALQAGVGITLVPGDWFIPAFRSNCTMLMCGVTVLQQFLYWNGQERGSALPIKGTQGVTVLPINIPIATQYSHAAGIGYALRLRGSSNLAVTFIGNGGTAEGEFYEAINFASIWKFNTVFCVNNNFWAISTPNTHENNASTIAAKAQAWGIPSLRVDGNDLLASYWASKQATDWVRAGKGPILIEFITWRTGPHTSPDNPKLYRSSKFEELYEQWDPILRLEKFMLAEGHITAEEIEETKSKTLQVVKNAFEESQSVLATEPDEIFAHTYEQLGPELERQRRDLSEYLAWKQSRESK